MNHNILSRLHVCIAPPLVCMGRDTKPRKRVATLHAAKGVSIPVCFTIPLCLCISPDFDGRRAPKSEILAPHDPQQVSKPKYEATALHARSSIGYPNSTNGQYALYRYYSTSGWQVASIKILASHNSTPFRWSNSEVRPRSMPAPINPRLEPRLEFKRNDTHKNPKQEKESYCRYRGWQ